MTNRAGSIVARIGAALSVFFVAFSASAATPLPTQYIAPAATPDWTNAILTTAYGQNEGFTFARRDLGSGLWNYFLSIRLDGVDKDFFAYDRAISTTGSPADSIVRSVTTVLSDGTAAPALRYLYGSPNARETSCDPKTTDLSKAENIENLAIVEGLDATSIEPYTRYVQGVHTDWVYTVAFDRNGGSGTMPVQSYTNSTTLAANAFARVGHTFDGWATSAGGPLAYADGATVSADLNLFARWKPNSYTVTFAKDAGITNLYYRIGTSGGWTRYTGPFSASSGSTVYGYAEPKPGYAVEKTADSPWSESVVTNDLSNAFAARTVEYQIAYSGLKAGATHANPATYTVERQVTFSPPTEVASFKFVGWDPPLIAQGTTGDKTIRARYEMAVPRPAVRELTYTGEPQLCAVPTDAYDVLGTSVTEPNVPHEVTFRLKDGYYWSDPAMGDHNDYVVEWKILPAAIADVSVEQSGTLTYSGQPQTATVVPSAKTQGEKIATWKYSTSPNGPWTGTVPVFTDVGAHTVYYKVEATNHNPATGSFTVVIGCGVILKGNGGTVDGQTETNLPCAFGEPYPELPAASRDGFAFAGWWTAPDFTNGVQKTTSDLVTAEALTLYARWKETSTSATCTVTFNPGEEGVFADPSQTNRTWTVAAALGDLPVPTATNETQHLFFGWYDADGKAVTRDTVVTPDLTLTAKWSEKKFNDALGNSNVCFTTSSEHPWTVDDNVVHSATMNEGVILEGSKSDLMIEVSRRGSIDCSVSWQMHADNWESYFGWTTGDVVTDKKVSQSQDDFSVITDKHLILRHWASVNSAFDRAWLNSLTWTPGAVGTTPIDDWDSARALSQAPTNAVFETGGSADWMVVSNATEHAGAASGVTAVTNGIASVTNLSAGCSTWARMSVNGPGVLTFKWKVSSEKGYWADGTYVRCDGLEFCDGDEAVAFIDGETDFATVVYEVGTGGNHAFTWRYAKDGTGKAGSDRGFVDAVTWTPAVPAELVKTVSLDMAGGTGDASSVVVTNGLPLPSVVPPTKAGYDFLGYFTDATGEAAGQYYAADGSGVRNWPDNGPETLSARWRAKSFTVTFDNAGGSSGPDPQTLTYGVAPCSLDVVPSKPDYLFVGYYLDDVCCWDDSGRWVGGSMILSEGSDVTLTARYVPVAFTVAFHGNGGVGAMAAQPFAQDLEQALSSNRFVRAGCAFAGWATDPTNEVAYLDGAVVSNLTAGGAVPLYAKWTGEPQVGFGQSVGVTFRDAEGCVIANVTRTAGLRMGELPPAPEEKPGYEFVAWEFSGEAIDEEWLVYPDATGDGIEILPRWTQLPEMIPVPSAVGGLVYNGCAQTGVVASAGFTLTGNVATNAGTHRAVAKLEAGYVWTGGASDDRQIAWTIAKATIDMSGVSFTNATYVCDGTERTIAVSGTVPAGVEVVYTGDATNRTEVGTNTVTASFRVLDVANYNAITTQMVATLVITPKEEPPPSPSGRLYDDSQIGEFQPEVASTYNGWLRLDGKIVAKIQVKTSALRSDAVSVKTSLTVTPLGGKKKTYKSRVVVRDGALVDDFGIRYGNLALTGTVSGFQDVPDGATIEAAKDLLKSRDLTEQYRALTEIPVGCRTIALPTAEGYDCLSVTIAKKTGKATVKGSLDCGNAVSLSAQGVLGAETFVVPVVYAKKVTSKATGLKEQVTFGFLLWIDLKTGAARITEETGGRWTGTERFVSQAKEFARPADGTYGLRYEMPEGYLAMSADGHLLSPTGTPVVVEGKKWVCGKAVGTVKYDATTAGVIVKVREGKTVSNVCRLKLTCASKTGVVKGSFKLYYLPATKVKAATVTVTGVAVDGLFLGNAVIKKKGGGVIWWERLQ